METVPAPPIESPLPKIEHSALSRSVCDKSDKALQDRLDAIFTTFATDLNRIGYWADFEIAEAIRESTLKEKAKNPNLNVRLNDVTYSFKGGESMRELKKAVFEAFAPKYRKDAIEEFVKKVVHLSDQVEELQSVVDEVRNS